jgi:hypothetical protein
VIFLYFAIYIFVGVLLIWAADFGLYCNLQLYFQKNSDPNKSYVFLRPMKITLSICLSTSASASILFNNPPYVNFIFIIFFIILFTITFAEAATNN